MEFANQIVLVTGGTAGIGLESARLFAREGAQVIITGRDTERGKKAVDAIDGAGRVRFIQADLADLDSVSSLVEQSGPVDVVVNNAGAFPVALTVEQDIAGFQKIFDTNVRGAYFLVAKLVPHMLDRGRGNIVNVTTMATSKGIPGHRSTAPRSPRWPLSLARGPRNSALISGSTPLLPARPGPTGCSSNGVRASRTSPGRCRWAAPPALMRSPRPSCSSRPRARATSPARRSMSTPAPP